MSLALAGSLIRWTTREIQKVISLYNCMRKCLQITQMHISMGQGEQTMVLPNEGLFQSHRKECICISYSTVVQNRLLEIL